MSGVNLRDNQYLAEEALYKAQRAVEAAQLALENVQQQAMMSQKKGKSQD